jgi:uridine kinase
MARINNYIEYINMEAKNDPASLIERTEERYKRIVSGVVDACLERDKGRLVIMLAGPSASGKTTTAHMLSDIFKERGVDCHVISLDDFYLDRDKVPLSEEGEPDFETVYALDLKLIDRCLQSLLSGEETYMPKFDFNTGKRDDRANYFRLGDRDVVIVEGLHALNPIVTENIPSEFLYKIYISVSSRIYNEESEDIILNKRNLRFIRRLIRDYKFRSSSVENTYRLWDSVRMGEDKYLFAFKDYADMRINTIHIYEPCVFKRTAIEMLETVGEDSLYYRDARRLIRALNKFTEIGADKVPSDSLLREFLG